MYNWQVQSPKSEAWIPESKVPNPNFWSESVCLTHHSTPPITFKHEGVLSEKVLIAKEQKEQKTHPAKKIEQMDGEIKDMG